MFDIAWARPEERGEVVDYLYRSFKEKIPLERWRALVDGRWGRPQEPYGVSLRHDGDLVGFIGVVPAERPLAGGVWARSGNFSSWYIDAPHRGKGLGLEMLRHAVADPEVTFTNFSSIPKAVPLMEAAGLEVLDSHRYVWRAGGNAGALRAEDGLVAAERLNEIARRLLADHRDLNLVFRLVEFPEEPPCFLVLSVKTQTGCLYDLRGLASGQCRNLCP